MGGDGIEKAMMATVLFLEAFNGAGIKTEVLGYTTDYCMHANGYEYGRIDTLRTYIFKTFNEPLSAAVKKRISGCQGRGRHQNCDVDSLLIAHDRLITRPEQRKVLFVLTDGAVANNGNCSIGMKELKRVAGEIEKAGKIELICFDLSRCEAKDYYKNVVDISGCNKEALADGMFQQIKKIFKVK
jgi:cobaltochelatase CobT